MVLKKKAPVPSKCFHIAANSVKWNMTMWRRFLQSLAQHKVKGNGVTSCHPSHAQKGARVWFSYQHSCWDFTLWDRSWWPCAQVPSLPHKYLYIKKGCHLLHPIPLYNTHLCEFCWNTGRNEFRNGVLNVGRKCPAIFQMQMIYVICYIQMIYDI